MNSKNLFALLCILGLTLLLGCQAEDSSKKKSDNSIPSDESLRLRINAPSTIQSILINIRAIDVNTGSFDNAFDIVSSNKVVYRDEFDNDDGVLLAIKPGKIEVRLYAFSESIHVLSTPDTQDLTKATYFGKSAEVTVLKGTETELTIDAYPAVSFSFTAFTVTPSGSAFDFNFQASESLPNVPATLTYSADTPDDLDYGQSRNQVKTFTFSGNTHNLSLSSSTAAHFAKVQVEVLVDNKFYIGTEKAFCETCTNYPNVVYDRAKSLSDDKTVASGILQSWKTTKDSDVVFYFSKNAFDQDLLIRQTDETLQRMGIYRKLTAFQTTKTGTLQTLTPANIGSETNAPTDFFTGTKYMFGLAKVVNANTSVHIPDTAQCFEDLATLGQVCTKIPRATEQKVVGNNLILTGSGPTTHVDIYQQDTSLTKVNSFDASFAGSWTIDLNYDSLATAKYFGRVRNGDYLGNWFELDVTTWKNVPSTYDSDLVVGTAATHPAFTSGSTNFFRLSVEANKLYNVDIQRVSPAYGALNNLWDAYLYDNTGKLVESSLRYLAGNTTSTKFTFAITSTGASNYYVQIVNPLSETLDYQITPRN